VTVRLCQVTAISDSLPLGVEPVEKPSSLAVAKLRSFQVMICVRSL
jgi:hypothetical protein